MTRPTPPSDRSGPPDRAGKTGAGRADHARDGAVRGRSASGSEAASGKSKKGHSGKEPVRRGPDFGSVLRGKKREQPLQPAGPEARRGEGAVPEEGLAGKGLGEPSRDARNPSSGDPAEAAAELGRKLKDAFGEPTVPQAPPPQAPPQNPGAPIVPSAAAAGALPPPEVLQGLVEYATLARNKDGHYEFRMGLERDLMGGMRIGLVGYGKGRLGLRVKPGDKGDVDEAQVEQLIQAMRERGIEVVDVEGL